MGGTCFGCCCRGCVVGGVPGMKTLSLLELVLIGWTARLRLRGAWSLIDADGLILYFQCR